MKSEVLVHLSRDEIREMNRRRKTNIYSIISNLTNK